MAECNHDCSNCSQNHCEQRDLHEKPNAKSDIKKVIGVVSGKGGVGKSSVTSLLAVQLRRKGYRVGILDADITGPSIPKMFNLHEIVKGNEDGIFPCETEKGIMVMSALRAGQRTQPGAAAPERDRPGDGSSPQKV